MDPSQQVKNVKSFTDVDVELCRTLAVKITLILSAVSFVLEDEKDIYNVS